MKFNLIILVAAYVFLTGCDEKKSTMENKNDAEREVLAAHEKRRLATLSGDADAVASMMTEDLTFTHANAVVESKAQFIEALETRRLQYQAITDEKDIAVRVHGGTGVVSGICRILVDASGTMIDIRVEFTELWVREQDTWKMMLWHATEVR
ncbi:Ketosteroid isomerase homolog [Cyclobacterium lianum]|uniref:Ketosteroid isomerase homolog n=1 Tax=Cyclobacterium lianum TaxID=388280 RepID=A0A1M7IVI4_9BACT|nr:nuclear transport factor 2 family protein [Cyclobacterium lianum]SHM44698.1 Ketosteroid isomerase homolog [Cyclobacterium lianum]